VANKLRELLLLRHAKSDWKKPDTADIDRPISDKGKKAACKIAHWFGEQNIWPDLVWVSPAKRAQQTLKRLNLPKDIPVETQDALYMADRTQLLALLAKIPDGFERVLLIGHNPGFEDLIHFLIGDPKEDGTKLLPTAALAQMVLGHNWQHLSAGDGRLSHITRPKDIARPCKEKDTPAS
jgi:phosphohistidine phosphatase